MPPRCLRQHPVRADLPPVMPGGAGGGEQVGVRDNERLAFEISARIGGARRQQRFWRGRTHGAGGAGERRRAAAVHSQDEDRLPRCRRRRSASVRRGRRVRLRFPARTHARLADARRPRGGVCRIERQHPLEPLGDLRRKRHFSGDDRVCVFRAGGKQPVVVEVDQRGRNCVSGISAARWRGKLCVSGNRRTAWPPATAASEKAAWLVPQ